MKGKSHGKESPNSSKKSLDYKKAIEALKEQAKSLKAGINSVKLQSSGLGSESNIARLQDQGDNYSRKIKQEKQKIEELDQQILEVQKLIEEKRKQNNLVKEKKDRKESNQTVLTKIKKTEHKLDKTLQKYNEAVAQNKNLRVEIDALRREKKVFKNIYSSLESELAEKETIKAGLKEKKKIATKKRDETRKKLEKLKEKKNVVEKELEVTEKDWKELERIIEKEEKISTFLEPNNENDTETNPLIKQISAAPMPVVKDKASIKKSLKLVKKYEEAFKKIEDVTGITDIESLVKKFTEAEEHNYRLFSYVNELTNEIEKLEAQIVNIKRDIEECKGQGIRTENQRKKIISDLESRLSHTEARAEAYEKKYEKTMVIINSLKLGVEQILDKIGCNNSVFEEIIQTQKVNESNLLQCLSVIELRTNEILQIYDYCTGGNSENTPHSVPVRNQKKNVILVPLDKINDIPDDGLENEEGNNILNKLEFLDRVIKKEADDLRKK